MVDLEALLARLDKVRRRGNGATALCPAHEDRHPSLSVRELTDGIAVKCFTGCTTEAICSALGLASKDLRPDTDPEANIWASYDYHGPDGELLYQVVRLWPKDFRQRRRDHSGWVWNLEGVQRVPYRLTELREGIDQGRQVFLVEGEKDADRLLAEGLVATTTPGGAGAWRDSYAPWFAGGVVRILPDNDPQGQAYAVAAAASLTNVAREVRIVALPDLELKGDVTDWLADHTVDELKAVVRQAQPTDGRATITHADSSVSMRWAGSDVTATIERLRVDSGWVWGEVSIWLGRRALVEYRRINCQSGSSAQSLTTELNRWDREVGWHEVLSPLLAEAVRRCRAVEGLRSALDLAVPGPIGWLVGDLWPDMLRPSLLFGDSEAAKSALALGLLTSISTGAVVLAGAPPGRTGPTAFLDWEDDASLFARRLDMICRGRGVATPAIYYDKPRASLVDVADVYGARFERDGVVAAVIDARSGAQAGSLSDDAATNQMFNAIERLGVPTMLVDHLDKATVINGKSVKHSFGSVFVRGRVVSSWLVKVNESTATSKTVTLHNAKWNHGPPRDSRSYVIDYTEGIRIDLRDRPYEQAIAEGSLADRMADALDVYGPLGYAELAEAVGSTPDSMRNQVSKHKDRFIYRDAQVVLWEGRQPDPF